MTELHTGKFQLTRNIFTKDWKNSEKILKLALTNWRVNNQHIFEENFYFYLMMDPTAIIDGLVFDIFSVSYYFQNG